MQTVPSTENLVQEEDNRTGNSCKALNGGAHGNFQIKNEDGGWSLHLCLANCGDSASHAPHAV